MLVAVPNSQQFLPAAVRREGDSLEGVLVVEGRVLRIVVVGMIMVVGVLRGSIVSSVVMLVDWERVSVRGECQRDAAAQRRRGSLQASKLLGVASRLESQQR